jgi:hypothetical protein
MTTVMSHSDFFQHLTLRHRFWPLRRLHQWMIHWGVGYVRLNGDEEQLWNEAMRHAPIRYRWFRRSLSFEEIDKELDGFGQWLTTREKYRPGDKIWPFVLNFDTLAMRCGYVLVRRGTVVGGVVTLVS